MMAYATVEPFGTVRDDLRAGEILSAIYATKGVRTTPADFFETLRPRGRDSKPPSPLAGFLRFCPALANVRAK